MGTSTLDHWDTEVPPSVLWREQFASNIRSVVERFDPKHGPFPADELIHRVARAFDVVVQDTMSRTEMLKSKPYTTFLEELAK